MSNGTKPVIEVAVFVAVLVLLFTSVTRGWPILPWVFLAVLVAVMVAAVARRQWP